MTVRLRALRLEPDAFVPALAAAWEAGDAVLPLALDAPDEHVAATLRTLRPHELVTLDATGVTTHHLDDPLPVPDGTALVVPTSGSTGGPKGVLLSRAAVDASTRRGLERLGARRGDRWALALPLHHVAGIQVVARSWALGTDPVVVDGGDAVALAGLDVAHVALVPTQLARVLDVGGTLAGRRSVLVGGARLDADLAERARAAGTPVVRSYGMTETAGGCVYDGRPLDDVEVAVRDDLRVRVRGPVLLSGYRDASGDRPGTDPDGWFTTGDRGRLVDGRLEVLGRADDVVVSGGENVAVGAVAARLATHPSVDDAAVVGRPDPRWGEVVVAVVVPTDAARPPDLAQLRDHVGATLPAAWRPRALVTVEALPRDAMGKPRRTELRRLAAEGT